MILKMAHMNRDNICAECGPIYLPRDLVFLLGPLLVVSEETIPYVQRKILVLYYKDLP
jgi:hypothetical protein